MFELMVAVVFGLVLFALVIVNRTQLVALVRRKVPGAIKGDAPPPEVSTQELIDRALKNHVVDYHGGRRP